MRPAFCLSLCLLLSTSQAFAECQLTASQPSLSYGRISPAERQLQGTNKITLAEKQVVLQVVCDAPSRIRLFIASQSTKGSQFGFGNKGEMKVTAAQAYLDDRAVRLSKVSSIGSAVVDAGKPSLTLAANDGLAFVDAGEPEATRATVTLTVTPEFENESITDTTKYTGNLKVRVETQ